MADEPEPSLSAWLTEERVAAFVVAYDANGAHVATAGPLDSAAAEVVRAVTQSTHPESQVVIHTQAITITIPTTLPPRPQQLPPGRMPDAPSLN